jgi:hypothetical protein
VTLKVVILFNEYSGEVLLDFLTVVLKQSDHLANAVACYGVILFQICWVSLSRLETRTKESTLYASTRV